MWDVHVRAVDGPAWGEILLRVILDVSLHGHQAAAELQAYGALVGQGPTMSPQVLDHGWVVPRALTTEATLKRFLPLMQREGKKNEEFYLLASS